MNKPIYTRFPIWPTFEVGAGAGAGGEGPDAWKTVPAGTGVEVAPDGGAVTMTEGSDFWKVVVGAVGGFIIGGPVAAVAGAGVGQAMRRKAS